MQQKWDFNDEAKFQLSLSPLLVDFEREQPDKLVNKGTSVDFTTLDSNNQTSKHQSIKMQNPVNRPLESYT